METTREVFVQIDLLSIVLVVTVLVANIGTMVICHGVYRMHKKAKQDSEYLIWNLYQSCGDSLTHISRAQSEIVVMMDTVGHSLKRAETMMVEMEKRVVDPVVSQRGGDGEGT